MKVVNKTKAVIYIGSKTIKPGETAELSESVIYIGSKTIKPGETAELSEEEAKMSGVKAMLDSGELEVVKESKKKSKEA